MSGKVVIIGGCAGAKVAYEIFTLNGVHACFYKNFTKDWGTIQPIILEDSASIESLLRPADSWFIATGDNVERQAMTWEYRRKIGCPLTNCAHQSAVRSYYAQIGYGILVCAQSVIGVGSVIGDGVIINTAATVDHDCRIGDFAQIGPGAHLAGYVEVGERANIGTGACVIPHIKIGKDATVAAGAVVIHDVEDGDTVMGVPAVSKGARK